MIEDPLFLTELEEDGTESITCDSSLFALISAKNGKAPPLEGGAGDSAFEPEVF